MMHFMIEQWQGTLIIFICEQKISNLGYHKSRLGHVILLTRDEMCHVCSLINLLVSLNNININLFFGNYIFFILLMYLHISGYLGNKHKYCQTFLFIIKKIFVITQMCWNSDFANITYNLKVCILLQIMQRL